MALRRDDTIAALATAPGVGAIAVVRLSGPKARDIARALTGHRAASRAVAELCERFAMRAGNARSRSRAVLPRAAARSRARTSSSFTVTAGASSATRCSRPPIALGARPAEAGEFTLRAFLNDKIDLLQAEAIADLVASGSAQAARAAVRSLEGEFSAAVDELQHALTSLRVRIEAWLDFPDEELPFDAAPECAAELDALVATARRARDARALGPRVARRARASRSPARRTPASRAC